jgi:TonB family protein
MSACAASVLVAQERAEEGPTNEKVQKTYKRAVGGLMPRTLICSVLFVFTCLPAFAGKDLKKAIKHYDSAGQALGSNDVDGAIAEYRKALKEDPDEPYWHLALAIALKRKGDRQGILDDYEVARKLAPDDEALQASYNSLLAPATGKQAQAGGPRGKASDYKPGSNVSPPSASYSPDPPYTKKARTAKYSGTSVVQIVVNQLGDVESVQVVKPLGLGLDENAVKVIRTWKFHPAIREGVPVAVRMLVEVSFRLF